MRKYSSLSGKHLLEELILIGTSIISGLVVFYKLLPMQVLNPKNVEWLYTNEPAKLDIAQSVTAQNSFLANEWHFPPGTLSSLGEWGNNSLLFSDALPLTIYPIKLLDFFFNFYSGPLQFFGINALIAILAFMLMTSKYLFWETKSMPVAILGSLLTGTLPQIFMVWGWPSLMFQSYIVASIFLFRKSSDDKSRLNRKQWLILVFAASLTHTYFIPFIFIFYLSNLIINLKYKGIFIFREIVFFSMPLVVGTFLAGGFNAGLKGSGTGRESVGMFSSDAFSYFNAGNLSYFVRGLPSVTKMSAYSYPGLAVIALILLSLFVKHIFNLYRLKKDLQVTSSIDKSDLLSFKKLIWIGLALFLISIGPSLTVLGREHFFIKNDILLAPFSIFRAHSRFAWALPLILVFYGIFIFVKVLGNRISTVLLIAAIFLQFTEFHNYYLGQRNAISSYVQTNRTSPSFSNLELNATYPIYFAPGFPAPNELPWRSFLIDFVSEGGVVKNFAYMNRYSVDRVGNANIRMTDKLYSGTIPSNSYLMIREDLFPRINQPYRKIAKIQDWELIFLEIKDDN